MKKIILVLILGCLKVIGQPCKGVSKIDVGGSAGWMTNINKNINVTKVISVIGESYYLDIKTTSDFLKSDIKGLNIILDYNKSIKYIDVDIDVNKNRDTGGKKYMYNVKLKISKDDFDLLKLYEVLGFELYIFKGLVTDPEDFRQECVCIDKYN